MELEDTMTNVEVIYTEFDENDKKVGIMKKHTFQDFQFMTIHIEHHQNGDQTIKIDFRKKPMTKEEMDELADLIGAGEDWRDSHPAFK